MTKTSIYCYEKNGGSCRNKVSLANNFICGAGHGEPRQGGLIPSETSVIAPAIDLSKMSIPQKRFLAWDTSTPPETLAEMAEDEDWDVRCGVAGNTSTPPETLAKLEEDEEWDVRYIIAENISTPLETYVSLAQKNYVPLGFIRGKSIDELIKDVDLANQYPDTFGDAYLYRLTYDLPQEDETHPKRRALIGYVYTKCVESDRNYKWAEEKYKDRIKALFPDDQEMAEIIGY